MKVLMLGWELPPFNSGGLGTACYQLCKALSKNNIDIDFILPYRADHGIDFMTITAAHPQGVQSVMRAGMAYDSQKYFYEDGEVEWLNIHDQQHLYTEGVVSLAEQKQFDIVHAHDWLTFRAALRLKELRNCPIILHVHSVESDRAGGKRGNPMVHEIEETAFYLADRIIAVSNHTKNMIIDEYGVPADKIEVVHNSIEADDIHPLDSANAYTYLQAMKHHGYRVVVSISRLTIQKGLPNLLRAAQKVVQHHPKSLFLIVGSGEMYQELVELSAELGIGDKVLFTDFQRGKNWRDAFAAGDLFVMPSVSEPFGLTPLEAAGYGTAALISKQSGVSEIFQNSLKVDHWDIDEMANKITAVLQNDALRDEISANAYHEYLNMSWAGASHKITKIYNEHLGVAV